MGSRLSTLVFTFFFCISFALLAARPAPAQERYTSKGRDRWENPLELKDMDAYEGIPFRLENFEKVERGMTETEVLKLLGKPRGIKKEHRPHNRWTVHYIYPEMYVVNFRDGLVVGKEKEDEQYYNPPKSSSDD
jgi:hypothetical protein